MVWGLSLSYFKTSFGALGTYLELSWSVFASSWGLFGGSGMRLGSSSGALEDVSSLGEPLFSKMGFSSRRPCTSLSVSDLPEKPLNTTKRATERLPRSYENFQKRRKTYPTCSGTLVAAF